jgi:hypothetical protein
VNIRTTVESDLDDIAALLADQSVNTATPQRYRDCRADLSYRHEWTWIAEDGDRIVALAIWWGLPEFDHPLALDGLYADPGVADPVPLWTELIRRAVRTIPPDSEEPEYHIFLPNGWRGQPEVVAALEPRLAAAAAAGLSETTERLRYEWTPGNDLRPPPGGCGSNGRRRSLPRRVRPGGRGQPGRLDRAGREPAGRGGLRAGGPGDLHLHAG